jgi:hypothetical protein
MDFYEVNDIEMIEIESYLSTGMFLDEDNEEIENVISSYEVEEVEEEETLECDFDGNDDLAIQYFADMMSEEDFENV